VVRRGGELHVVLPGDPEYPTADSEVGRR